VKVELDPVSLQAVSKELGNISDTLTRQMLWHTLWEMVVDDKLRVQDYAEVAISQAAKEKDSQILGNILRTLALRTSARESVFKFAPISMREELFPKIEEFLHKHLMTAPAGSDLQLIWFQRFLSAISSKKSLAYAHALLTGKASLPGMTIDQERRWDIISALAASGAPDAAELINAESVRDPGDMGKKRAIAAEASIPDQAMKDKWLAQIMNYPKATPQQGTELIPIGKLREAMSHFQEIGQESFTQAMVDQYFEKLPSLVKSSDEVYAGALSGSMYPSLCDASIVTKTEALLKTHPELPAEVVKNLKINAQEEGRCIRARALGAGSAPQG
jgi:aminopeptidase N